MKESIYIKILRIISVNLPFTYLDITDIVKSHIDSIPKDVPRILYGSDIKDINSFLEEMKLNNHIDFEVDQIVEDKSAKIRARITLSGYSFLQEHDFRLKTYSSMNWTRWSIILTLIIATLSLMLATYMGLKQINIQQKKGNTTQPQHVKCQ